MIRLAIAMLFATPAAAATLIVGNKAEDTISLIDLASGKEVRRLPTGRMPHEIAVSPDGRQAAVVAYGSTTIDIVDLAAGTQAARIDLAPNGAPHGIVWRADGRIIATTEGSSTLTVVDAATRKVTASIPTGQAGSHMVAVSPDGSRAYVTNLGAKSISVIDLVAGRKLRDLGAGIEPEGLALTPDGRELWVAARGSDEVHVFATGTLVEVARIKVGDMPIRLAISPDGRSAVTSNLLTGDLSIVDVATRKVVRSIKVSGDKAAQQVTILFSTDGTRLYVAETARAQVAEVELSSGRVLRRLAAGKGSDGLGVSAVDVAPRQPLII